MLNRAGPAVLLLVGIAGCSHTPGYNQPLPPYAILTSIRPDDPRNEPLKEFAAFRHAHIIRFQDFDKERSDLTRAIHRIDPMFVAFVVPPEALTPALAKSAFELLSRLDDDPFADCHYGFVPARDSESLRRFVKNLKGQSEKLERRLFRLVVVREAAAPETRLEWADNLPVKTVGPAAKADIERTDYLLIEKPFPVGEDLRLQSVVAFSSVPGSATGAFADALFRQGLYALIAPLGDDPPGRARTELEHAILVDEPLGEAVKASYDLYALSGRIGTRVLIGDPMIHPFRREDVKPPLAEVSRVEKRNLEGKMIEVCKFQVRDINAPGTFVDEDFESPAHAHLHVKIKLKTRDAVATLVEPANARITAQAVEEWRGVRYLHVLVALPSAPEKGTILALELTPKD